MKNLENLKTRAVMIARDLQRRHDELQREADAATTVIAELQAEIDAHCRQGDDADRARRAAIETHKIGAELGVEPSLPEGEARAIAAAVFALGEAQAVARQLSPIGAGEARLAAMLTDGCDGCRCHHARLVAIPCRRCNAGVSIGVLP
jgi:hypothetical protein